MRGFLFALDCALTKLAGSRLGKRFRLNCEENRAGMELVQVAILIAIAVTVGLIFRKQIKGFVEDVFGELRNAKF